MMTTEAGLMSVAPTLFMILMLVASWRAYRLVPNACSNWLVIWTLLGMVVAVVDLGLLYREHLTLPALVPVLAYLISIQAPLDMALMILQCLIALLWIRYFGILRRTQE